MSLDSGELQAALLSMDRVRVGQLLREAQASEGRMQAIEGLVVPTMNAIGSEWEQGRLALAQVYMSGRICEQAVEDLLAGGTSPAGDAHLIGLAVYLDQHQLGKRIVASVLRASGFQVLDYGAGMEPGPLAQRALEDRVPILMVSVLMLHSALRLKELKAALGSGPGAPVLIAGGAPFRFDPSLGSEVGVDAVGASATDAARLARHFLGDPCPK